jgi:hypothetical protein
MSASVNNITLLLNQQDSSGVNILNRSIGAISYSGILGEFLDGILLDASAHSQTFPSTITTALQFYFKNTHASAIITVTWTHTTGSSAVIQAVSPGGILVFWNTASTSPAGITALSLQSDTANATFEMFIGG